MGSSVNDQVKQELILTLALFKHDFEQGSKSLSLLKRQLERYGEISIRALKRYQLSATSAFFNWTEIVDNIRYELAKELGLNPPEEAWGLVQKMVARLGRNQKPEMDQPTKEAIDGVGGWTFLCNSTNKMADRANFLKIYKVLYDKHLTEKLLNYER